jgi:hypothetical protein
LLSWNFLSASCTFLLTLTSIISMKFSLFSCRISSYKKGINLLPILSFDKCRNKLIYVCVCVCVCVESIFCKIKNSPIPIFCFSLNSVTDVFF